MRRGSRRMFLIRMITYRAAPSAATRAVSESFGSLTPARFSARRQAAKAAMSGNRWSARSKRRARRLHDAKVLLDRVIDDGDAKFDRQRGRRRGEGGAHRGGGHADRAEIVRLVVGRLVLRLIAALRGDRCDQRAGTLQACPVRRVNMTEGQGQIDGERNQREPRTLPDMITKPAHSELDRRLPQPPTGRMILSDPAGRSIGSPSCMRLVIVEAGEHVAAR
jgi:hypothetical protein